MSMVGRAAQFAPFAALTGYDDVIAEEGRLTDAFHEMDESEKAKLDAMLLWLQAKRESHPEVKVLYFIPDQTKEGGSYEEAEGRFLKVDPYKRELVLEVPSEKSEAGNLGVPGNIKFGIEISRIVRLQVRRGAEEWREDPESE